MTRANLDPAVAFKSSSVGVKKSKSIWHSDIFGGKRTRACETVLTHATRIGTLTYIWSWYLIIYLSQSSTKKNLAIFIYLLHTINGHSSHLTSAKKYLSCNKTQFYLTFMWVNVNRHVFLFILRRFLWRNQYKFQVSLSHIPGRKGIIRSAGLYTPPSRGNLSNNFDCNHKQVQIILEVFSFLVIASHFV